jgi:hypothetical protein
MTEASSGNVHHGQRYTTSMFCNIGCTYQSCSAAFAPWRVIPTSLLHNLPKMDHISDVCQDVCEDKHNDNDIIFVKEFADVSTHFAI